MNDRVEYRAERHQTSMQKILIIGASGFVGRHLTKALLAEGHSIRCLARDPARVQDLAAAGCEIVQGDISDLSSVLHAIESVQAVYIAIHMLSPQPASHANERFMAVELNGLKNVVTACQAHGARRLIYVTSLGVAADASSEWLRERWRAEQYLLESGLDATVIRPGMIAGTGGRGFDTLMGQAKQSLAIGLGSRQRMRTIAVDDLIYYLVGVLDDPRAYRQCFDVGNDDVLTNAEMIDTDADVLGRRPPTKLGIPLGLLGALAPLIERAGKFPNGSFKGFLDSLEADASGDPTPIRSILPRALLTYRQAVERALAIK
jgi:uncharacterized protein YbjT (DUF2867 family)